jgi:arylsulfatase A-like enzyme
VEQRVQFDMKHKHRSATRRTVLGAAFLLCALGWSITCSGPETRYNVILVSIDTLRPDHLGCYGYERATSPTIDRLARQGIRFDKAFSSTTWTLPAHLALLTSLPDIVHGVTTEALQLHEQCVTLPEILQGQGYQTWGVFTGPFLMARWGFGQGFDSYRDATVYDKKLEGAVMLNASERGQTTQGAMQKVRELFQKKNKRPFFLFLHLFDVHPDFDPLPPYDTMFTQPYSGGVHGIDIMNNPYVHKDMPQEDFDHLIALYDGEIRGVDELGMAALLQMLDEFGLSKNTLVVVTSDHGEEFFEHGVFGHHQNLFDSTLQIPLVIWGPSLIPFGKSVGRQVRIIDIMPTILDLLNLPQSPEGLGQSLREFWEVPEGVSSDRPVFAEVKSWKHYLEALRLPDVKYIRDYSRNEKAMVDLSRDPREIDLLSGDEISSEIEQTFQELRYGLISYQKGLPWQSSQAPEMDQELRERLKSLGYIK